MMLIPETITELNQRKMPKMDVHHRPSTNIVVSTTPSHVIANCVELTSTTSAFTNIIWRSTLMKTPIRNGSNVSNRDAIPKRHIRVRYLIYVALTVCSRQQCREWYWFYWLTNGWYPTQITSIRIIANWIQRGMNHVTFGHRENRYCGHFSARSITTYIIKLVFTSSFTCLIRQNMMRHLKKVHYTLHTA